MSSDLIIVGAGVFGLSTAIAAARKGYSVDVFDRELYDQSHYSPIKADCDAASADINKIIRASYGGYASGAKYQKLAFEAMDEWDEWNRMLAASPSRTFGPLNNKEFLWDRTGFLRLQATETLSAGEQETIDNVTRLGKRHTHYHLDNVEDVKRGHARGVSKRMKPFPEGLAEHAVLDMTSGVVLADKACTFALALAKQLGVRFHFGPSNKLSSLIYFDSSESKVVGIKTVSGASHFAASTILACGGWTPALLPNSLNGLLEATAGSVAIIEIPRPLRHKYGHASFPVWGALELGGEAGDSHALDGIGGLYGFPCTEDGLMKFGYRGTKFTHFPDSSTVSVPATVQSSPPETRIPVSAFKAIENFITDFMPDVAAAGVKLVATRLCWYTDSVDNDFLIDHVPGKEGLLVASGGSGHGFKFLPVLGNTVVSILERTPDEYASVFAWRDAVKPGDKPRNGLGEGRDGPRVLSKLDVTNVVPASLKSKL